MYNVYQHWDPLKVCIVGKSYPPEFYSFITNSRVRTVMERIAQETEEDFQTLVKLLESFGVKVLRPTVSDNYKDCISLDGRISPPPMTPRDYSAMIGETFYFKHPFRCTAEKWQEIRGSSWPIGLPGSSEEFDQLPEFVKKELKLFNIDKNQINSLKIDFWKDVINKIPNTIVSGTEINSAMTTRIGKDLYFGTDDYSQDQTELYNKYSAAFTDYRCHIVNTGGHSDGTFCPVKPGLIVSLRDIPTYADTFPGWEVVYLPGQSWDRVSEFILLKHKNSGKWWVPGEELNDDFTHFVESWLDHWVGYVEETVFDVNMLVIDEKNVVCNNYNKQVFDAFDRYGITPHVVNFRHRYFWDGGLHCITSDLHREGTMQDYFPNRVK